MSRCLNRVELIGALGADPDVRHTQAGDPVATLRLATNEGWTDKSTGECREDTQWHRLVLWRGLAEVAQQYTRKGSRLWVAGKLKTRKWQDQSGQDRYTTEVEVHDLIMLDPPNGRDAASPPQPAGRTGTQRPTAPAHDYQAPPGRSSDPTPEFDDDIPF